MVAETRWMCAAGVGAMLASVAVAGVVKEEYGSATVFGFTTSGLYDFADPYTISGVNWEARLSPARPTEINNTQGVNFFTTLSGWAQGTNWTFASATNTLSENSLVVRTYDAQGTTARVGAEFHVEYVPHGNDPTDNIHWIQVVKDNHLLGQGGGHGVPELIVDTASPNRRSPYYDDGYAANGRHFYDFPGRIDPGNSHTWDAELFLVVGPAPTTPGLVTIYRTGISWGWENTPAPARTTVLPETR